MLLDLQRREKPGRIFAVLETHYLLDHAFDLRPWQSAAGKIAKLGEHFIVTKRILVVTAWIVGGCDSTFTSACRDFHPAGHERRKAAGQLRIFSDLDAIRHSMYCRIIQI